MAHYGGSYPPRQSVDAYRASPVLGPHRGMGGGGGGGGGRGRSYGFGPSRSEGPLAGPEVYGFQFAGGLPGFEGAVAGAVAGAGHQLTPEGAAAAEARYLALLCHEALADFRAQHAWDPALLPAVETVLRTMTLQCTPSVRELQTRLQAMARLKDLAQSGIAFCVGLDLEPYGSFVSGLYTPHGDLDLSIEGTATWRDEQGHLQRVTVDGMDRDQQVKFLRALASRIQGKRLCLGQVERILHARVPILKFRDTSGLDFDVGIGGSQALFKSTMLGLLAQFDWRFGALVRLVKLWARHHDVNDSANGSLNSFALTLLVIFHLQTRRPAVLPPLCSLCGGAPGDPRPMQEGRFPDWRLLSVAGDRLSQLSRGGGPGGGNSETLLELLASFFALFEGLMSSGWAAPKGADAGALRGVLRRVRVDTWAGRLRYERWDREGYCMSIEDPFDSTDNCARTVRKEEKVAQIAGALARGRQLLMELEQPHLVERALQGLFGQGALRPRQLHDLLSDRRAPAVQWVRPVDLVIPPRIQAHTEGRIPLSVHVNHQRRRGGSVARGFPDQPQQLAQQLAVLELNGHPQQQPGSMPPPPGLGAPVPGAAAPVPAAAVSLQDLRQLMQPRVAEEAARLTELERQAAEQAAAVQAAREERRAAKKAAQRAEQAAKRAERERLRAERGRARSKSRSRSRSSRRSRSGSRASLRSAQAAAAAAVSNLGRGSSLASSSAASSSLASISLASSSLPAAAVPAAGAPAAPVAAASVAATIADGVTLSAAVDDAAFTAAADALSESSSEAAAGPALDATEPAAAGPLAALAAEEAAAGSLSEGGGSAGSGGGRRKKQPRYGKQAKQAARERKERRNAAAGAEGGGGVAVPPPPPPPPGLGGAAQQQQQQQQRPQGPKQQRHQQQQHAGQPESGQQHRQPSRRGRSRKPEGRGGEGSTRQQSGSGAGRVLTVQRPPSGLQQPPPLA